MNIEERFKINIIAALSQEGVIGINNTLPWHIPEDLKRFKELTTGHTVIMGRKTYESIGRPLPNRENIVLSTTLNTNAVKVSRDMESALEAVLLEETEVFIIGGQSVYEEGIKFADNMYLTVVRGEYRGDTYFPDFDETEWVMKDGVNYEEYSFIDLRRRDNESCIE